MKVIIIGAGGVGYVAAETLSELHDVMVIENDPDVAELVKNRLNVSVLNEDGTNPRIIQQALENHKAEVIITTMKRDDSNLFVCLLAKRLKPTIVTVASVTNPDYIIPTSTSEYPGVDIIISPELITAEMMYRLCTLENALAYENISNFNMAVAIFEINQYSNFIGEIVMNTYSLGDCSVFALYRNNELYFQVDTMEIHVGDRLCVIGSHEALQKYNEAMWVETTSRDIVILGGTIVGMRLASLLAQDQRKRYVRLIEKNDAHCREMSRLLTGVVIVNGDFTEPDLQSSENIFRSDVLVSVTNQDDTNLLMCMSAQKYSTNKIVSRYLKKEYKDIFMFTGLATIIGFNGIVANEVSKCVMSESKVLLRMRNHEELFFVHEVTQQSKLFDRYYGDLVVPEGIRIVSIYRQGQPIYPAMDTKFAEGDRVIVFTNMINSKGLSKVFGRNAVSES